MHIIFWLIVGALAGWIASMIVKTNQEQGTIMDIVVGIIGAVIGGWVFDTFLGVNVTGFWGTLVSAIVGAVILLGIIKLFKKSM
jgi:uncharacterized membrane protein YeaQ/YmgE (transglycosylase-associated protein family)